MLEQPAKSFSKLIITYQALHLLHLKPSPPWHGRQLQLTHWVFVHPSPIKHEATQETPAVGISSELKRAD